MFNSQIKEAFGKVKADIDSINNSLLELKDEIKSLQGVGPRTTPQSRINGGKEH